MCDDQRCGALEDVLQHPVVLPSEPARLRDPGLDPSAVGGLHPVGARAGHDRESAVAPELSLGAEAMRRDDDRHEPGGANRSDPGCRLQDPYDLVLSRHPQQIGLDLLLLLLEEVELVVETLRTPSRARWKLLLPLVAKHRAVDRGARCLDPTRPVQALQASLYAHQVACRRDVCSRELPKQGELSWCLEDPLVE